MAYMFVRHSVRDYEAWKPVFDDVSDLRKRSGEKSYQILRQENASLTGRLEDSLQEQQEYRLLAERLQAAATRGDSAEVLELLRRDRALLDAPDEKGMTPLALAGSVFYIMHHIIVKTNLFLVGGDGNNNRG